MSEASELKGVCAEAARRGGAVLRDAFGRPRTISYKGGIDLVTDADHASEAALLEFLRRGYPEAAVLAEESGASGEAAVVAGDGLARDRSEVVGFSQIRLGSATTRAFLWTQPGGMRRFVDRAV